MNFSQCVVDASVGIKLFVNEELSGAAESLLAAMGDVPEIREYVPDLFFTECANVLWKYVVRHGYPQKDAIKSLSALYALSLVHIPTPMVTQTALTIALDLSISVYDACYVATAELIDGPLVTADKRLADRLVNAQYHAYYLGDVAL